MAESDVPSAILRGEKLEKSDMSRRMETKTYLGLPVGTGVALGLATELKNLVSFRAN